MTVPKHVVNIYNVPNALTMTRIILALVMFAIIPFEMYRTAFVLFLVAASTDWVDGWWARKFHLVTQLGRIFDPFADKMLVCGSFIFLLSIPELGKITLPCTGQFNWGLEAWMVAAIVMREMLVTMLRSLIEGAGGDFSAKWIGKWKTGIQCVAVPACLAYLICLKGNDPQSVPTWIFVTMILSIWVSVVLTLWSGFKYILAAIKFTRAKNEENRIKEENSAKSETCCCNKNDNNNCDNKNN